MVYKAMRNLCPQYLQDMFQLEDIRQVPNRTTRAAVAGNLYPASPGGLELLTRTFKHSALNDWNDRLCGKHRTDGASIDAVPGQHCPSVSHFTWYKAPYWIITMLSCLGRCKSNPCYMMVGAGGGGC